MSADRISGFLLNVVFKIAIKMQSLLLYINNLFLIKCCIISVTVSLQQDIKALLTYVSCLKRKCLNGFYLMAIILIDWMANFFLLTSAFANYSWTDIPGYGIACLLVISSHNYFHNHSPSHHSLPLFVSENSLICYTLTGTLNHLYFIPFFIICLISYHRISFFCFFISLFNGVHLYWNSVYVSKVHIQ